MRCPLCGCCSGRFWVGAKSSPLAGRGTGEAGGGASPPDHRLRPGPSTTGCAGGSPPRPGEDFVSNAARLAGHAGILFGWAPDIFWAATPAELGALVAAVAGEQPAPVDLAALMEAFPDG
ncbi:MAG: phage tail assembly chaperone [Sphingomonas sp.]|nr:MAG: phage tail assembly chaperone [Sphingomonas sp.]